MDNEIISLAPQSVILDTLGPPGNPILFPTPILPGLCHSVKARGLLVAPAVMPSIRGSMRVSFVKPPTPTPGFGHLAAGAGFIDPAGSWGTAILGFDDDSLLVLHSYAPSTLAWACATTGPVPPVTLVTITASWDAEKPIDGPFYAKAKLEGYPLDMPLVVGGTSPWITGQWTNIEIGEGSDGSSFIEPFPGVVGRVQWSTQVVL